jgi:TetR/AcrR family transcriptional repressor of nem operon
MARPVNQKTEQKEKSHEAILASAASLMRGRGIRASSVTDVMKGAGLTVGGFYGHFDSKEQLFTVAIRNNAGTMWTRLMGLAKGASPRERVLGVVRAYLSRTHRDNPEAGCLLPSVAPEVAREGEPYRSALEPQLDTLAGGLANMLGPSAAHREQALGLVCLMYGALSLSRAVAGTKLSDELLRAARKLAEGSLEAD